MLATMRKLRYLTCSGQGLSSPVLSVSRTSMNLGLAKVAQSVKDTIRITNIGSDILHVSAISCISGAFTVSQSAMSIGVGQSIIDTVVFTPTAYSAILNTMTISSDGGMVNVKLAGSCPYPLPVLSQNTIAFGPVPRNTIKAVILTVANSSINTLHFDSIYTRSPFQVNVSSADVSGSGANSKTGLRASKYGQVGGIIPTLISKAGGIGIVASDKLTDHKLQMGTAKTTGGIVSDTLDLTVSFSSAVVGQFADTIYLVNNSQTPLVKIPVSASCPPPQLSTSVSAIVFGEVRRNDSLKSTVVLSNMSITNLTINSIATSLNRVSVASIPSQIGGSDSLPVTLVYKPTSYGSLQDTLIIESELGKVRLPISGSSPYPLLVSSMMRIDLGTVGVYDSAKTTLKLTNTSINTLTIDTAFTSTPSFSTSLKTASIAKGETLSVAVTFSMSLFGNYADTFVIKDNAQIPTFQIPLNAFAPPAFIVVSPETLSFGKVRKDTLSQLLLSIVDTSISRLAIDSLLTRTKYLKFSKRLPISSSRKAIPSKQAFDFNRTH